MLAERSEPTTLKSVISDYSRIVLGCLFLAVGIYFFQFPNEFVISSVTGISILISRATHYAVSRTVINYIINTSLLVVGYIVIGKEFTIKTTVASLLFSSMLVLLEILFPIKPGTTLTNQPFLELVFGVVIPAIGSAILFNVKASSGGTDIVAMILKKYTDLNLGNALIMIDAVIATSTFFIYHSVEKGMLCILGLLLKAVVIDFVFDNFKTNKCFHIITSKPDDIADFIVKMGRSATILNTVGAYTHKNNTMLVCIVSRQQAVKLREFTKKIDPHSFAYVTNTMDIMGKGFKYYN